MIVAGKIAAWTSIALPLWLLLSARLRDIETPFPEFFGAVLAWTAAGLLLGWALPLFGHELGLPWVYAFP
jgi:hypothetical protein